MRPTEENNRLGNFDFETFRLVYAGENGASRSANKKTHYTISRRASGLTYGLTGDMRTMLRTGFGITYFPSPYAAGNLNHLNVPFDDLAERPASDQSARLQPGAHDRQSVSTDRAGQADDDRGTARGQSARDRSWLRERNGVRRAVAPRHRAPAVLGDARRARIRRQRRQTPHALLQPERDSARTGHAGIPPPSAARRERQQHAAVRSAEPLHVPRRHAEGAAAVPWRCSFS